MAGALLVHVVVIALLILVGFTLPEQSMGKVPGDGKSSMHGELPILLVEVDVMPEETAPEMPEEREVRHADAQEEGRNSCHKL